MAQHADLDVTGLLLKWRDGDKSALDAVVPLVYRELRRAASARLRRDRARHSLQTTALVHETYLRLVELNRLRVESRTHFFAVAARLMRQVLVDHARRERAAKRGGGATAIDGDSVSSPFAPDVVDILALDEALTELAAMDQRLCRVVELKFFAGLTIEECGDLLDLSPATVERDWAIARTWLFGRLGHQR